MLSCCLLVEEPPVEVQFARRVVIAAAIIRVVVFMA
jgi:hypothetical protein